MNGVRTRCTVRESVDNGRDRDDEVVKKYQPAGHKPQVCIQTSSHISVGGTGDGIQTGHAPVARSREHHGHHGNQDRGDHVPIRQLLAYTEEGNGGNGLDDDDTVEDQIPKSEDSAQARYGRLFSHCLNHKAVPLQRESNSIKRSHRRA